MEQSHSGKCHCHSVLVRSLDNLVVTNGSAGLCNVLNAALLSTLDVITEGEECIGTECNVFHGIQPRSLFFSGKYFGFYLENSLPGAFRKYIFVLLADVYVDCVVSVRTADAVNELKSEYLRRLYPPSSTL